LYDKKLVNADAASHELILPSFAFFAFLPFLPFFAGRSLGEVTKYLVYNMRKRQEGGDSAAEYFNCTKHVAGIEDVRFQQLVRKVHPTPYTSTNSQTQTYPAHRTCTPHTHLTESCKYM
jgi:hypothetical protein